MTRRRAYQLIAALGLVGLTVVGVWNSLRENSVRHDRELRAFDWGNEYQLASSAAVVNAVRVAAPFDEGTRRFSYYTGALSPGTGESSAAPQRVIAEAVRGEVAVRLRAFEPYSREGAGAEAEVIAKSVSLVTTQVWPGEPTPVQVDVHFMPDDAPFSQAMRVDWRDGDAFAIAVFARARGFAPSTAVHELYHALAARWSLGRNSPAGGRKPNAAHAYEEVAATLFAECGRLLATESLPRAVRNDRVDIAGQLFEGPLDGEELGDAIELLVRDASGSQLLRNLLAGTILDDAFGAEETIALASPQGEKLLARCREVAANPLFLEFRLASILGTGATQSEQRTQGD